MSCITVTYLGMRVWPSHLRVGVFPAVIQHRSTQLRNHDDTYCMFGLLYQQVLLQYKFRPKDCNLSTRVWFSLAQQVYLYVSIFMGNCFAMPGLAARTMKVVMCLYVCQWARMSNVVEL